LTRPDRPLPVRLLAPSCPDHGEVTADGPARDRGSGQHLRQRGALPGRGAAETACRAADARRECAAGDGDPQGARSRHRTGRIVDLGLPRRIRALRLLPATPPGLRPGWRTLPALRRPGPRGRRHGALELLLRPLPALSPRPGAHWQAPEIAGQLIDSPWSRLLPCAANYGASLRRWGLFYAVSNHPGVHHPVRPAPDLRGGRDVLLSASRGHGAPDPLLEEHLHPVLAGPDRGPRHGRPRPGLLGARLPVLRRCGDDRTRDRALQEGRGRGRGGASEGPVHAPPGRYAARIARSR